MGFGSWMVAACLGLAVQRSSCAADYLDHAHTVNISVSQDHSTRRNDNGGIIDHHNKTDQRSTEDVISKNGHDSAQTGILHIDSSGRDAGSRGVYLNSFAVQVKGDNGDQAREVADTLGFTLHTELPNIQVFLLKHPKCEHRSKRRADHHLALLRAHPKVRYVHQEVALVRVKRHILHDKQLELPIRQVQDKSVYLRETSPCLSPREFHNERRDLIVFDDPYFEDMWYLKNRGQSGGERFLDLNVEAAWAAGYSGLGVVVSILDDGVDHTHPDLANNYDAKASTDLNDKLDTRNDPMPNTTDPYNSHGTRCAGEIAASANNQICGLGVAYNAKIGGVRILDGVVTDSLEAEALSFNRDYIDVYSASWGPTDDGRTMEAPSALARQAFRQGILKGRGGLGSIFVWATGNGGLYGDDCNADGYTSRVETLSVGSITDRGRQPFFMENCSAMMAVVPSGGEEFLGQERQSGKSKLKVVTTDMGGGCIENFQGTSSAAPLAAGCIANVLQANPLLTWRDVQHIVVHSARVPSADHSWTINGAGHHVSHKFGFGLLDCSRMVQLAQDWNLVPQQHVCSYSQQGPRTLPLGGHINDTVYVDACKAEASDWLQHLEHVRVKVTAFTRRRGDTRILLVSPSGTRSELLSPRPRDDFAGQWEFTFMTVHCWGENPQGLWRLEVHDSPSSNVDKTSLLKATLDGTLSGNKAEGILESWTLTLLGTAGQRFGRDFHSRYASQKAYSPSAETLQRIKREETHNALNVLVQQSGTESDSYLQRTKLQEEQNLVAMLRKLLPAQHGQKHTLDKRVLQSVLNTNTGSLENKKMETSRLEKLLRALNDLI